MDCDFDGEWYGWRLRGRHLVSPDGQRMTVERLKGLMWRDAMELRLAGYVSRRKAEDRSAASRSSRFSVCLSVALRFHVRALIIVHRKVVQRRARSGLLLTL